MLSMSSAPGLVSVVIPTYNRAGLVRQAVESALAQTHAGVQIIVVDDGSTDSTLAALEPLRNDITYVFQENRGRSAARNAGFALAKGEFLVFLDSDDLLPPTRLRLQASYLLEHPAIGAVFGRQEWLNPAPWMARDAVYGDIDGIPLSSAMFRREVLLELGGYDQSFVQGEDMDLLIRMRERGIQHAVLSEVVLYRRFHETSLTGGRSFHNPLLRSLRAKLEREQGSVDES
jgi:glycosyltransferase involved in cell wall biosynthesis